MAPSGHDETSTPSMCSPIVNAPHVQKNLLRLRGVLFSVLLTDSITNAEHKSFIWADFYTQQMETRTAAVRHLFLGEFFRGLVLPTEWIPIQSQVSSALLNGGE